MTKLIMRDDAVNALPVTWTRALAWAREGKFPRPIRLGPRTLAFRAEDVEAFVASKAEEREGHNG